MIRDRCCDGEPRRGSMQQLSWKKLKIKNATIETQSCRAIKDKDFELGRCRLKLEDNCQRFNKRRRLSWTYDVSGKDLNTSVVSNSSDKKMHIVGNDEVPFTDVTDKEVLK